MLMCVLRCCHLLMASVGAWGACVRSTAVCRLVEPSKRLRVPAQQCELGWCRTEVRSPVVATPSMVEESWEAFSDLSTAGCNKLV